MGMMIIGPFSKHDIAFFPPMNHTYTTPTQYKSKFKKFKKLKKLENYFV